MKRVAVISAILNNPADNQAMFNEIVAASRANILGRMGLPIENQNMAVISITMIGDVDEINSLTGKLGRVPDVQVKTAISKKEVDV